MKLQVSDYQFGITMSMFLTSMKKMEVLFGYSFAALKPRFYSTDRSWGRKSQLKRCPQQRLDADLEDVVNARRHEVNVCPKLGLLVRGRRIVLARHFCTCFFTKFTFSRRDKVTEINVQSFLLIVLTRSVFTKKNYLAHLRLVILNSQNVFIVNLCSWIFYEIKYLFLQKPSHEWERNLISSFFLRGAFLLLRRTLYHLKAVAKTLRRLNQQFICSQSTLLPVL